MICAILVQSAVFGVGFSFAYGNADSGYSLYRGEIQSGVYGARCWYQRAEIRTPAWDSRDVLDFNSYTQSRVSSTNNCTGYLSGGAYPRPPFYLGARATLYKSTGNTGICVQTSWDYNRNDGAYSFGLGRGLRRDATDCGSGNYKAIADVFSRWNLQDRFGVIVGPAHNFENI